MITNLHSLSLSLSPLSFFISVEFCYLKERGYIAASSLHDSGYRGVWSAIDLIELAFADGFAWRLSDAAYLYIPVVRYGCRAGLR